MGLGFTVALCIISAVREFIGQGTVWGITIYGGMIKPAAIIGMPPGGFIVLGILIALINFIAAKKKQGGNE